MYFQTCDRLADYVKEVEICPGEEDVEMTPDEEKLSKSEEDGVERNSSDYVTPQRVKTRRFEQVESSSGEKDPASNSNLAVSASKTEPLAGDSGLMCDESIHCMKQYTTNKKSMMTTKISHLNSLSEVIGTLDMNRDLYSEMQPEIVFHSPFCPLPPNVGRNHFPAKQMHSPCFKGECDGKASSSEYSCHNHECKHEKAFCRVFDEGGRPIPFHQVCPSHPCYLVVPQTPDSKMNSSNVQSSTPEKGVEVENVEEEKTPEHKHTSAPSQVKSKAKGKSSKIVRLKTGRQEEPKSDLKRKRKEKKSKVMSMKTDSVANKVKAEGNSIKNIGKQVSRREETKEKPMTCNCKKSRCLKFYCDCLADGRMCTPECNCCDCANNQEHIEERKQFLEKNNDYFNGGALEEVVVNGKKILRHTKGCGCSNSGCMKKYCECFKFGVECSEKCKCKTCHNNKLILSS